MNAMKTIIMRIRSMNEETEEFDDTLKNISGDVYELTHGQVRIMEDENTYRDVYDILDDINKVWDSLSDKEHASLTELLFGKHRANVGSAMISNFDTARNVMKELENSQGSAQKEMEKYYDSLEYKINNFRETITGIAQSTITRDFLKGIVDDATTMLKTFENFETILRPLNNSIGGVVSLITILTESVGGLDKVLTGLALSKSINGIFKGLFGADRTKKTVLISMSA